MNKSLNEKYFQLASDLANILEDLPEAKYTLLIGSVADQTADQFSDIDTIVLYDGEPSEPKLETYWVKNQFINFGSTIITSMFIILKKMLT